MAGILDEFLLVFKPIVKGGGFQALNKQVKKTHDNLFSLKNLFSGFIGYDVYSGLKQFAGSLVQTSQDLGAMTSRFYAITKSEQLANKELEWSLKLAKDNAVSLKSTADSYSIFYAAARKGLGQEGVRQVFKDWTEVSRVLHLSDHQFERVTYALREMTSKGAIYSQDLRMQIGTHVPNAMGLAQKAVEELGITGNDWFETFQDKAKGNQKLINEFVRLFSKYAKEMFASPEALAKAMEQPDAQIWKLKNTWTEFQMALVKSGFEKDLVQFLKLANTLLNSITRHSSAIYKITKSLVVLFGLIAGGKVLGIGIRFLGLVLRVARVLKAGKGLLLFAGVARTVKTLTNIGKTIKQLFLISQFSNLAKFAPSLMTKFGKFAPLLARLAPFMTTIVGFLTNPIVLGALLIAGGVILLGWMIKTFCPNLWETIMAYWRLWRDEIIAMWYDFQNSPLGLALRKWADNQKNTQSDVNKTIGAWYKRLSAEGGILGNSRYTMTEAQAQMKAMEYARKSTRNNPMDILHGGMLGNWLFKTFSQRQREYNQNVSVIIKGDMSGAEKLEYMKENNPALFNTAIRAIKNAIKNKGK